MITEKVNLLEKNEEETSKSLKEAREIIKNGGLVIFPTETVYGLGADALNEEAVKKIFLAKGRPQDNPLIIHVADKDISPYVKEIPETAKRLMEKFWPGPLTILFKKSSLIPDVTTANLDTVGIRMPKDEYALKFLKAVSSPIAAPSANISGSPSPTTFRRCVEDMDGRVDMILGADKSEVGLESTIVDVTVTPMEILRPGGITLEELQDIDKDVFFRGSVALKENEKPRAPGMKYRHYAPKAEVEILRIRDKNYDKLTEIVTSDDILINFSNYKDLNRFVEENKKNILGKVITFKSDVEGAREIFECLRHADDMNVKKIYIVESEETGIGLALMNRLKKASGFKIREI